MLLKADGSVKIEDASFTADPDWETIIARTQQNAWWRGFIYGTSTSTIIVIIFALFMV